MVTATDQRTVETILTDMDQLWDGVLEKYTIKPYLQKRFEDVTARLRAAYEKKDYAGMKDVASRHYDTFLRTTDTENVQAISLESLKLRDLLQELVVKANGYQGQKI